MPDRAHDRIHIRDLRLRCIVGTNPEEREKKQDVVINITLTADLAPAAKTDALEDTVNYKAIKRDVVAMVEPSSFQLLETMAERIAGICLQREHVQQVTVLVEKPGALRFARTVGIEITRDRATTG